MALKHKKKEIETHLRKCPGNICWADIDKKKKKKVIYTLQPH